MAEHPLHDRANLGGKTPMKILGPDPFGQVDPRRPFSRAATVFPLGNMLVTVPGIHASQRLAYLDLIDEGYRRKGHEPLSEKDRRIVQDGGVDLFIQDDGVLIRPEPSNMELAFRADELLQERWPKHKIRFLFALEPQVRSAINRRGDLWRIMPVPRSVEEMEAMIRESRASIGGQSIYYQNKSMGTRFLTCREFAELPRLGHADLQRHLVEIQKYSAKENAHGNPEVAFFTADHSFSAEVFQRYDFDAMDPAGLESAFEELRDLFLRSVAPEFQTDAPARADWRSRMFSALIGEREELVSEEALLGLSWEFFCQVEWLPGGRIEDGELILDSLYFRSCGPDDEEIKRLRDVNARKLITNFASEYSDLEYINIGRVAQPLCRRRVFWGRRDVYLVAMKRRGRDKEIVRLVRWQKFAVREHLDEGRQHLEAINRSEDYTVYIMDRRRGCLQLGMNLSPHLAPKKMCEKYHPDDDPQHSFIIWTPYFERDYIRGIASDKLSGYKLRDNEYAIRLARLLGQAAAANLITGRVDFEERAIFDDGEEVVVEDQKGMPVAIVAADHTGTFANYRSDLEAFAKDYAGPVLRRLEYLPDPEGFAAAYLEAFVRRFSRIQQDYRKNRQAFDSLFDHRFRDEQGSFAYRWEKVLARLDRTDPRRLAELIRESMVVC